MDLQNTTKLAIASCSVVQAHDVVFDMVHSIQSHGMEHSTDDLIRIVSPYTLIGVGLVLCFLGHYAIRVVIGLAAFCVSVIGTVRLLQMHANSMTCDILTLIVVIAGGISALIAVFMTRFLSTLLGAAGSCTVVAATFVACGDACNADLWDKAPRWLGMTLSLLRHNKA